MVLLTMTPAIVAAVNEYIELNQDEAAPDVNVSDPSLSEPAVGKPISHAQVINLWRFFAARYGQLAAPVTVPQAPCQLDYLLRGSKVYVPPPKPKPEPSTEYATLMAHLRKEEEAIAYERMVNPQPARESFAERFPASTTSYLLNPSAQRAKEEADELTYADINRQLTLIVNVLISIVTCSIAIWLAARHWSTPLRLSLSMGGSGLVAVAEVVIYAGYLRRMKEAKRDESKKVEKKVIMETWISDREKDYPAKNQGLPKRTHEGRDERPRRRKGEYR